MKDLTPILWIAGAVALYFAYQNWFAPIVPAAAVPAASTNIIPIASLTPAVSVPFLGPTHIDPAASPMLLFNAGGGSCAGCQ